MGVATTSKPLEGRTHQQVKPKCNKKAHTNRRKSNPRASREGDQRDCTIESHRTPATEIHPTNKKRQTTLRQRKNAQLKGMEESPVKELNEQAIYQT